MPTNLVFFGDAAVLTEEVEKRAARCASTRLVVHEDAAHGLHVARLVEQSQRLLLPHRLHSQNDHILHIHHFVNISSNKNASTV
jgi:hypothetical protein